MTQKYSAFSYKPGNSFIHKMPSWIKILLIPVLNIIVFNLPWYVSLGFVIIQFILAFALGFSVKEQTADLKPVIYYAILLYFTNFIAHFCSTYFSAMGEYYSEIHNIMEETSSNSIKKPDFLYFFKSAFLISFTNSSTIFMLLKLFSIIQSASIVFKTSTSLEIREGLGLIESCIRKILPVKKQNTLTNTISLFVCFIPMVYKNWEQAKKAWFARMGKHNVKMYLKLLPVLFSVGMKQAYNSAKAVAIRSKNIEE